VSDSPESQVAADEQVEDLALAPEQAQDIVGGAAADTLLQTRAASGAGSATLGETKAASLLD